MADIDVYKRQIPQRQAGTPVRLVTASGEMSEDIFVAKEINRLIGGIDMLDAQGHLETGDDLRARSFSDIAVPVSYTHLDVYKRQPRVRIRPHIPAYSI